MKLSVKASALLAGLVAAVIAAVSVFLIRHEEQTLRQVVLSHLASETQILSYSLQGILEDYRRDTEAIAGMLPHDALAARDAGALRAYLKKQYQFYPGFENGLFVLDAEGSFLGDFPPHPELVGQNFAFRDYFKETVTNKKGVMAAPYISARTGAPVLTLTAPVKDASGRVLAVLGTSVNLLSPKALGQYQQLKIGRAGYIYIVDQERTLIIHPDKSRILTKVPGDKNHLLDMVSQGYEGAQSTMNSQGVLMLAAAMSIPGTQWTVISQLPDREAMEPVNQAMDAALLFLMAALAATVTAGFFCMRRITMPLEKLERAADIIKTELEAPRTGPGRPFGVSAQAILVGLASKNEIGRLADAFFGLTVKLNSTLASLNQAAEDWERTFGSVQEALMVLDAKGTILRANPAAEDLCRAPRKSLLGRSWREALAGHDEPPPEWPDLNRLNASAKLQLLTKLPRQDGVYELHFTTVSGRDGGQGFLLVASDVTDKLRAREHIRKLAFHDALTGLPNRLLLSDRLAQALATADRNGAKCGVLFLDLDDFKSINDTLGHDAGDALLMQAASRLSACLRANDTLARYGGDEFVVILQDISGAREAEAIARRMLECIGTPFALPDADRQVGVSIGAAIYPDDGREPGALLGVADMAMYRAKTLGKNTVWITPSNTVVPEGGLPTQ